MKVFFQNLILSRKFWEKVCSFSNKFPLWKLFRFKVWNKKFSIQKLTDNKIVLSYCDALLKSRFNFWRVSTNWSEIGLVFNGFYFFDLRLVALSRIWNKMSIALETLIRELSFFFSKKVFLWILIFRKSRKCQLTCFYDVNWHQKLTMWNRSSEEFCSPKIIVFLKSDAS